METGELEWLMRDEPQFIGVFAADTLPKPERLAMLATAPYCAIVNTDPMRRPGEHWLALFFTSPFSFEFFDSYALPLQLYISISRVLLSGGAAECTHSMPFAIQHPNSDFCGHYCVYFLKQRLSSQQSFKQFHNSFSTTNLRANDKLVSRILCTHFNYCARSPQCCATVGRFKQQTCQCRLKFII